MLRLAAKNNGLGHILVVDDDESMRELASLHLRNAGYRVETAADATVAARLLLQKRPDLLIVDVEMPYWNGLDFVATVRADSTIPMVPVIAMTAHEQHAQRAHRLGIAYLLKPFLKDALLALVEETLGSRAAVSAPAAAPLGLRAA